MIPLAVTAVQASSISPAARAWVSTGQPARVLHVFARSCNLINARGAILSLVSEEIGDGPFNAVLPGMEYTSLDADSAVGFRGGFLWIDGETIALLSAPLWNPSPDWTRLRAGLAGVRARASALPEKLNSAFLLHGAVGSPSAVSLQQEMDEILLHATQDLTLAINRLDRSGVSSAARRLAGLGEGLTPAGDDVLIGALYAARIIHGREHAGGVATAVLEAVRGRTTPFSLSWLEAAARGEAAIRWHDLLTALLQGDASALEAAARSILATGHTSGVWALHGFARSLLCHSA